MDKLVHNNNLPKSDFNDAQYNSHLIDEEENVECTSYLKKQGPNSVIIILPSKELEKFCKTSNLASYELISKQMSLFKNINNFKTHLNCPDIYRRV